MAEKARRALEDPRLTGEPRIEGDGDGEGAEAPGSTGGGGAQGGFDMGRAIVQPRVVYSGVHAAAFAYAARTLAATWDRPLATPLGRVGAEEASTFLGPDASARSTPPPIGEALTKGGVASAASAAAGWLGNALRGSGLVDGAPGPRLACTTPTDVLLSLERRLAPLLEFLSSRRRGAAPEDPRSRGLGLSPQLRQRRRLNGGPDAGLSAAQAEERSFAALRGTLRRTTQACALLRACCGDFLGAATSPPDSRAQVAAFARTCAGLAPAHRAALSRMTLRRFASTPEGAAVAAALVDSLMRNASLEGSESAEALADALSRTAPLFFGGDERAWYKGRELLQLARDERDRRNLEASDRACAEALEILLTVPLAGDPTAACAELADLRCFHGVVALCLSAAAESANRRAEFGSGGAGACAEGEMRSASGPSPGVPEGGAAHGDQRGFGFRRGGSPTSPLENGGAERRFGGNAADLEQNWSESRDSRAGSTTTPRDPAACHEYACVAIRALALGAVDDRDRSPPGSLGAVCAALPAEARARGLAATLRRAAQASSAAAAAAARAEARSAAATAEAAHEAARVSAEASREAHGLGHGGGMPVSSVAPPGLRSPPSAAMVRVAAATPKEVAGASAGGEGSFLRRVFAALVDLGRDDDLFSLPAAPLEAYLADLGAFETARQGGALTQSQARHLELLAKLYAEKRKPGLAAQVFYALAERVADGAAVALEERGALLDLALSHARGKGGGAAPSTNGLTASSGGPFDVSSSSSSAVDAEFVDALEGKVRVFGFQSRLRAAFQHIAAESANHSENSDADPSAAVAAVAALERELLPLSDMYNDFARPAEMYDVCLEMLHFSRYDDPEGAVARELWERYLVKSANRASTRRGALDSACAAAARLGRELFPSDAAFPTSHVALHLELMAAGQWGLPEGLTTRGGEGPGEGDLDATGEATVASAVLRACRDDAAGAFAAYDRLLAPPGAAGAGVGLRGEARAERERRLQTPALRLRLLASAAAIVRRWDPSAEERSSERGRAPGDGDDHRGDPRNAFDTFGGSRDASVRAALADACAAYAGEARRLLQVPASAQGAAEALAAEFDRLAKGFA